MFTDRELLILSFCVDHFAQTYKLADTFFDHGDTSAILNKIHNMRRATALASTSPERNPLADH